MCNVRLKIALGQVRSMAAGHPVLGAAECTDEHRAERGLLNAHNTLTAAWTILVSCLSTRITEYMLARNHTTIDEYRQRTFFTAVNKRIYNFLSQKIYLMVPLELLVLVEWFTS